MVGLGGGGEALPCFVFVAVEPEAVFAEKFRGDVRWTNVAGKFDETTEIEVVVSGSVGTATFFDF